MRVLSLNTWHGECRPALRAFLLSQLETVDVFCLQEASGDAIEEIITTLFAGPEFQIAIATKDGYVSDGYCVYIIAKKPPEWATFLRIDRFWCDFTTKSEPILSKTAEPCRLSPNACAGKPALAPPEKPFALFF